MDRQDKGQAHGAGNRSREGMADSDSESQATAATVGLSHSGWRHVTEVPEAGYTSLNSVRRTVAGPGGNLNRPFEGRS